ncbi:hypothetical protein [Acholeplasma laidlawii]|uniref:hypothetical protein n=1 Tax=Acholeplasma laidlawii TaxID=2148 RepID=UPI0021F73C57|nr:hypothetical protein [Acholeplasma laidlawii]
MKKTALIAKLILFILTLASFIGSAVFAWVAFVERTQPIMLYSGKLTAEAKLFQLVDPNYDGEDPLNEYTEITSAIHFQKVVPGQIFTFRLEVKNAGTVPAHLKVVLALAASSNANLLDVMHIVYDAPKAVDRALTNSTLFEEIVVNVGATYTFNFQIVVTEFAGNFASNQFVVIENLIVTLDQIQNL